MTVLVAYASKHGATREIAEAVAETIRDSGGTSEASPVHNAPDPSGYDAVVLGSALYFGSWMEEAADYVRRNHEALAQRPVWLFSSRPLGTDVEDAHEQPRDIAELHDLVGPREHKVFFGPLDASKLGFSERMVVKAVRAPEGDYRDWDDIRAWAGRIAEELH